MRLKFEIPAGFIWNHVNDRYEHKDGSWFTTTLAGDIGACGGNAREHFQSPGAKAALALVAEDVGAGQTAPRVTPADIEAAIKSEEFVVRGVLTICILTLRNGFTVTGESACVSPANFNEKLGRDIARKNAVEKIWPLLGYALREKLTEGEQR